MPETDRAVTRLIWWDIGVLFLCMGLFTCELLFDIQDLNPFDLHDADMFWTEVRRNLMWIIGLHDLPNYSSDPAHLVRSRVMLDFMVTVVSLLSAPWLLFVLGGKVFHQMVATGYDQSGAVRLKLTPAEMKHKWEEEKVRSQKTEDVESGKTRKRSVLSPR